MSDWEIIPTHKRRLYKIKSGYSDSTMEFQESDEHGWLEVRTYSEAGYVDDSITIPVSLFLVVADLINSGDF